jgi:hypothetical protein
MEAARISETSGDNYFTRQYIPEDKSELNTRRRENLKSHIIKLDYFPVTEVTELWHRKIAYRLVQISRTTTGSPE